MNKEELIHEISKRAKITKTDAKKFVNAMLETIKSTLAKKQKVMLRDFGTFKLQKRAARTARHINENKEIKLPATTIPVFIPSESFKNCVENAKNDNILNSWYPHNSLL